MTRPLLAALAAAATLAACANPPPRCAPRGDTYTICSDQDVWECPTGPADVVAFNKNLDEQCNQQADPVKCVLDADYKMIEMTLKADCDAGGMVCVASSGPGAKAASCQMPMP